MAPSGMAGLDDALAVFSQRPDARVEVEQWNAHATRFFRTRLGLAELPAATAQGPSGEIRVALVVAPDSAPSGVRTAWGRRREPEDLAVADAAEARAGGTGLALLARRCSTVWVVRREGDPDALALRLAAIFASIFLGPILDAVHGELYGVRTAREKLTSADGSS